jgi:hypothetical protein
MLPAAEKITLVLEGIGDDKIRIHSFEFGPTFVDLARPSPRNRGDRENYHPTRIVRQPTGSTRMPWAWPRSATGRNEIVTV